MFNRKLVEIVVSGSSYPFVLTISTCNGFFIAQRTITAVTRFCLCTNACCIRLKAQHCNETITKSIILQGCRCERRNANFSFSFQCPIVTPPQTFNLQDRNYNLPIQNARLNFESI